MRAGGTTVCAAGNTTGAAACGNQTRTPISCNMARWRWSRSRLMRALSQTQAHHHCVLTLAVDGGVVVFALADAAIAVAFVHLQRTQIARP